MTPCDTARFRVEDPDELVAASLVCRYCLRTASDADIATGDRGAVVRCYCPAGCRATDVALDREQVLRLALYPPPNVCVSVSTQGW